MKRIIIFVALAIGLCRAALDAADAAPAQNVTRVVATLNGVFSPRGFFNITVRLYQVPGIEWAKFDLKRSRMTLDFKPGIAVTPEEIQNVMVGAGYKPGAVTIESLAPGQASETGPGWVRLKHPASRNSVARWFQLNF